MPRILNIQAEMHVFDTVLQCLGQRIWSLLVAPMSGPDFLCCDHPVILRYKNPNRYGPVGFGLAKTEVFFPLGHKVCLYGVFEDPLDFVVEIKAEIVEMVNWWVVGNAERHVFSLTKSPVDRLQDIEKRKGKMPWPA